MSLCCQEEERRAHSFYRTSSPQKLCRLRLRSFENIVSLTHIFSGFALLSAVRGDLEHVDCLERLERINLVFGVSNNAARTFHIRLCCLNVVAEDSLSLFCREEFLGSQLCIVAS